MKKRVLLGAAVGAGLIWASRQPGGLRGTMERMQQCCRDCMAGQDPMELVKRFFRGGTEEPAGIYTDELTPSSTGAPLQPYQDQISA